MEQNLDNNLEVPSIQNSNSDHISGIKRWQVNTMIILGLLLLITLGLIFYVIAFKKPSNNNLVSLKTTSTTKKVANPYKGWLTYTNSTYGYSFKYPPSWKLYTSNYPNTYPQTKKGVPAMTANTKSGAEVELLNTDGANIIFKYNQWGLGNGPLLASKIEKFNINYTQYDLVFLASNSQSNCPQLYGHSDPYFEANSLLPKSCIQNTNYVYLVSSNQIYIQNIHGNYYVNFPLIINTHISDPLLNTNNSIGFLYLTLPSAININSINTNSDIKVFENLLKSLQLP